MGIGHAVYKTEDPRATWLRKFSKQLGEKRGDMQWFNMSQKIERAMLEKKGMYPNVDFYSASAYYLMDIPLDQYTPIFAVSRVSGWTGHILEQYGNNKLIRPRAEYIGKRDQNTRRLTDVKVQDKNKEARRINLLPLLFCLPKNLIVFFGFFSFLFDFSHFFWFHIFLFAACLSVAVVKRDAEDFRVVDKIGEFFRVKGGADDGGLLFIYCYDGDFNALSRFAHIHINLLAGARTDVENRTPIGAEGIFHRHLHFFIERFARKFQIFKQRHAETFHARRTHDADGETRQPHKRNFTFFAWYFVFKCLTTALYSPPFAFAVGTTQVKANVRKVNAIKILFFINIIFTPF
jgi:hypothetical protein